MEKSVRIKESGKVKTRVGVEICDGPKTYRLLVTQPISSEGQVMEIPIESIVGVSEVESRPRGDYGEILDQ